MRLDSQAEVDPGVPAGQGRRAHFGEAFEPGRLVVASTAPQQGSVVAEAVIGRVAGVDEFGIDGAEPGIWEVVIDIPLDSLVVLGVEFLDRLFAGRDLGFSVTDVIGEPVDLVLGRGLLLAAVAAELGEGAELLEALPGAVEAMVCPVQLLLG